MTTHTRLPLALAFSAAISLCGAANYNVSGVVVDSQSQKPLANARVLLAPAIARGQKLEQITKQDGRFAFMVTQAGKHTLQITKPGYPVQSYRQAGFAGVSSAIVVGDGQDTSHIVFEASHGGAITGQIKDEDSEPVGNALISVFQSSIVGGERKIVERGQTRANAAGEFRLSGLPRGNYYVCAMGRPWFADSLIQFQQIQESFKPAATQPERNDKPAQTEPEQVVPQYSPDPGFRGSAFMTTFYPQAQTIEEAALVRLDTGGETQVSITLPLAKAVSVKGAISLSGEMSAGRAYLDRKVLDQYILFGQEVVAKDGTFQFKNVPAGSYEIVAASDSSSGASSWNARQGIEVGASDIEVTLRPAPMGAVSGHVLFEGQRPASTADLFVSPRNETGNLARSQVDPEGNFSFSRLAAGRYEVTAGSADYVAAYFAGPSGERLPLGLEITSVEPLRRDLMLTKAVSVIEGTVEKTGVPQVGAFVLLMPKDPSQRWAYRIDQTDSDGSYRLATIPSGDYFLIALSDGADVAYRDPKVAPILTKAAKPVHVEPGDHLDMKVDVVGTSTFHLP
jgi:hypothetical protein